MMASVIGSGKVLAIVGSITVVFEDGQSSDEAPCDRALSLKPQPISQKEDNPLSFPEQLDPGHKTRKEIFTVRFRQRPL
jgi:hypothetical protein